VPLAATREFSVYARSMADELGPSGSCGAAQLRSFCSVARPVVGKNDNLRVIESEGWCERRIRTLTLLRAPAPQAKDSERRSQPTPVSRGRPAPIVLQILANRFRSVHAARCRR
jgi:hypothetical protein